MKHISFIWSFILLRFFVGMESNAQTVPWSFDTTSISHTITFEPTGIFDYNYSSFSNGDAIGVFYSSGNGLRCAGFAIWSGTGVNLVAYGAVGTVGGLSLGEPFIFGYWNRMYNCTTTLVSSLFVSTVANPMVTAENEFTPNGISKLRVLTALGARFSYNPNIYDPNYFVCKHSLSNPTLPGFNVYQDASFENANYFSSPGLSIQSATGFIDVNQSQLGTHTVSVFTNTCLLTYNAYFTINPSPTFSLGSDTIVCSGLQLPLSTSITGTYSWSTGGEFSSIIVSTPGLYSLTITGGNGCLASDTIQVGFGSFTPFSLGNDTVLCHSNSYELRPTATGSGYLWSTNEISPTILATTSGLYWGEVSNGGCTTRDSIQVIFSSLSPIILGNDISTCVGAMVDLSSLYTATGYYWSTGNTSSSISVNQPGLYTLTVFGTSGCTRADTISVSFLPSSFVQLGRDTVVCSLGAFPISFNTTGSGYLWSTGQTTTGISVTSSGLYWGQMDQNGCLDRDSIIVTLIPPPLVSLGNDISTCVGAMVDLSSLYTATGYYWSTGNTSSSISVNQPGLYTLTVFGATGCTRADTISVSFLPSSFVQLGRDTVVCSLGAFPISFNTTGSGYLWSTGQTTTGISVTSSGLYWGQMDQNGCLDRDSITVTLIPPPLVSLGNDISTCVGAMVDLSSLYTATGYLWSTGNTSSSISVNQPGLYTLTVFGATGCTRADTISVSFLPSSFVQLGRDTVVCSLGAFPISFNTTGSGYLWSTGQTTTGISVTSSGLYWGQMDQNGCLDRDSITVTLIPPPLVSLGNDISTCVGAMVDLSSLYTATGYLWSTGNTSSSISVNQPGLYTLTVFGATGCSQVDTISVRFTRSPEFTLGRDTVLCQGSLLVLSPTQTGTGYMWSTGLTTNTLTVSTSGIYSLTLTGSFGCKSSSSLQLTIASIPSFSLGKDTTICFGNPIVLAPTISASQFTWSTGAIASSITVTTGGIYFLKVRSTEGCTFSDTLRLTEKNINLDALEWKSQPAKCNQLGQLEINENSIKNAIFPLRYSLKNIFTNQFNDQSIPIFESKDGLYELAITDAKSCVATYSQPLLIAKTDDCKNPILAPNSNGTIGSVFVPLPGTVKIYDKNGVLKKQFLAPNEWDGTDESGQILPMGDYFLVSSESNQTLTITILK